MNIKIRNKNQATREGVHMPGNKNGNAQNRQ